MVIESSLIALYTEGMNRFVCVLMGVLGVLILSPAVASSFALSTPSPIPVPVWLHDPVATGGYLNDVERDGANNPHVLFVDASVDMLRYARRVGGVWAVTDLRPFPDDAPPADLAFDLALNPIDDTPIVAYVDASQNALYFGSQVGATWKWEQLGPGGRLLSLRVSNDGVVHLSLVSGQVVTYYTLTGENWITEPIGEPDAYVWNLFLDLDTAGRPHVAGTGANGSFHASRVGPDDWSVAPLSLKNIEGLAIGPDDQPSYLITEAEQVGGHPPFSHVTLSVARQSAGDWVITPLWEGYDWYVECDTAVDPNGLLHVTFYDTDARPHYVVVDAPAGPFHEVPFAVGEGALRLALDSNGWPLLSHYDGVNLILSHREIRYYAEYAFLPIAQR